MIRRIRGKANVSPGELFFKANELRELAQLGESPTKNLGEAIALYEDSRKSASSSSFTYHASQLYEGQARIDIALLGVDPSQNYERAAKLIAESRPILVERPEEYARFTLYEANARAMVALLTVDKEPGLRLAEELYREAIAQMNPTGEQYVESLVNRASTLSSLSSYETSPTEHLTQAMKLLAEAKHHVHPGTEQYDFLITLLRSVREQLSHARSKESNSAQRGTPLESVEKAMQTLKLARTGNDPIGRLSDLVTECRRFQTEMALDNPISELTQAMAEFALAEYGVDVAKNINNAATRCFSIRQKYSDEPLIHAVAANTEGLVYSLSARVGGDRETCIKNAVKTYQEGISNLPRTTDGERETHAALRANQAHALVQLAHMGINPVLNSKLAVNISQQARDADSIDPDLAGSVRMNEANAHAILARLEQAPHSHAQEAVSLYKQALTHFRDGTPNWGKAHRNLARTLRQQGKLLEAHEEFARGLRVIEVTAGEFHRESGRVAFLAMTWSKFAEMVDICLEIAVKANNLAEQERWERLAWHWGHAGRARTLRDVLSMGGSQIELNPLDLEEIEELSRQLASSQRYLANKKQELSRQQLSKAEMQSSEGPKRDAFIVGLAAKAEAARVAYDERRNQLLNQLFRRLPSAIDSTPVPETVVETLHELARSEKDNEVAGRPLFIDFFVFNPTELIVYLVPIWKSDALLVRRMELTGGGLDEDVQQLDHIIREATKTMGNRDAMDKCGREFETFLEHLGRLIRPFRDLISDLEPSELILSPHSYMESLPLHAATWSGKSLIERYPVSYIPSAMFLGGRRKRSVSDSKSIFLVGNPHGDLESAEEEVKHVDRVARKLGFESTLLLRNSATTSQFLQHAGSAQVIHLACHSAHDTMDLLRSGWELKNRRLSVLEVMARVRLSNNTLVFLNSCESAHAEARAADEVVALARAFLYAGAPTLVATLWSLADEAGYGFAETFYNSWMDENLSLTQSFQQAMLKTKSKHPNPLRWAPFVAIGEWNTTMKRRS